MPIVWCDTETWSENPIAWGAHRYAEHAEVIVSAWAIDDGPAVSEAGLPAGFRTALLDPTNTVVFHNSGFDRTVLRIAHGIDIPLERTRCTMAQAMAHGLPGGLEKLGEIFGLAEDERKLKIGKDLVRRFCIPRTNRGKRLPRCTAATHPTEWALFLDYARMDVESMRTMAKKLPGWNYPNNVEERRLWALDQEINDRGVGIDRPLAEAVVGAVTAAAAAADEAVHASTDGRVDSVRQRDALLVELLQHHGIALPDMRADTLERRLADDSLPRPVRQLIETRLEISQTSTSKYKKLLDYAGPEDRVRGTLQFCGAQRTGRWAGRGPQLQNLARPTMEQSDIDAAIDAFLAGCADLIDAHVTTAAVNVLRGVFTAPVRRILCGADLANIEGRALAWAAGEAWKLEAFRAYDAGIGPDLYKASYGRSFAVNPDEVTKPQRQVGKVQELALGYVGGVGAFCSMAAVYRLDLDQLATDALENLASEFVDEAESFWEWAVKKRKTYGLARDTFVAIDGIKRAWRAAHPAIVQFWNDIDRAARRAIGRPGQPATAGPLSFDMHGAWLRMRLPSGRFLCYPGARIGDDDTISYLGINQYTRQWGRVRTYSGKFCENAVQAIARDVLATSLVRAADAGYSPVLTVHDEIVCEEPVDSGRNHVGLAALMTAPIDWAPGLPLAAEGFDAVRYRK